MWIEQYLQNMMYPTIWRRKKEEKPGVKYLFISHLKDNCDISVYIPATCTCACAAHYLLMSFHDRNKSLHCHCIHRLVKSHNLSKGVYDPITFGFIHRNGVVECWYQKKAPIFLITPVKSYGQEMLILKVTSENVAKVQKLL